MEYVPKYHKIYSILACSRKIKIPINDLDAWVRYPQYRFIYNKMELCRFQNILHAPMPLMPESFPIVIKPIINLYGMGLECYIARNEDEFADRWHHYGFWMEYLEGNHYSYDIMIYKGEIVWHCCFQGHLAPKGTWHFDYWESCQRDLPEVVKKFLKLFSEYTGCINIECIGDTMVEGHLRMGDVDQFAEKDILENVIRLYSGQGWTYEGIPEKVYLIPVWGNTSVIPILRERIAAVREICSGVLCYQIDEDGLAHPPGMTRIMNLTIRDYETGMLIRERLMEFIRKNEE